MTRTLAEVQREHEQRKTACPRCGQREVEVQLVIAIRGHKSPDHNGPGRTIVSKTRMVCESCAVVIYESALAGPEEME